MLFVIVGTSNATPEALFVSWCKKRSLGGGLGFVFALGFLRSLISVLRLLSVFQAHWLIKQIVWVILSLFGPSWAFWLVILSPFGVILSRFGSLFLVCCLGPSCRRIRLSQALWDTTGPAIRSHCTCESFESFKFILGPFERIF